MEINEGFVRLKAGPPERQRTLVVTGIGRSGTTAAATALYEMGLPRIGEIRVHNQEDMTIGRLIESRQFEQFRELVARRNESLDLWGFKWTNMYHFPRMLSELRNPRFVLMTRDVTSIAIRNGRCAKLPGEPTDWMLRVHQWQSQLIRFAIESPYPVLIVSYEKLLTRTEAILSEIADFTGLQTSESVAATIQPESRDYVAGLPLSSDDPESYKTYANH